MLLRSLYEYQHHQWQKPHILPGYLLLAHFVILWCFVQVKAKKKSTELAFVTKEDQQLSKKYFFYKFNITNVVMKLRRTNRPSTNQWRNFQIWLAFYVLCILQKDSIVLAHGFKEYYRQSVNNYQVNTGSVNPTVIMNGTNIRAGYIRLLVWKNIRKWIYPLP